MRPTDVQDEARLLVKAWQERRPVPPPSSRFAAFDRASAYRVQDAAVELLSSELGPRVGWKLGLTSLSARSEPFAGPLLAGMVVPSGGTIRLDECITPRVEVEVAVLFQSDVLEPPDDFTALDFEVAPAIEVIDDRTHSEAVDVDWVADLATMRCAVIGTGRRVDLAEAAEWRASLHEDGREIAAGRVGDAVVPVMHSLMWLIRHLADRETHLVAGDVVLTGSITGQHRPASGRRYRAELTGFAPVEVTFEGPARSAGR